MKFEFSAGGVVYKRENKKLFFLLIKDHNNNWTLPKGLIKKVEDKKKTAEREIKEETGLEKITFKQIIDTIEYWYRFENQLIKKRVYYFLFEQETDQKLKPQKKEGINDVCWFDIKKVLDAIGYKKNNQKILKKAIKILKNGLV